MIINEETVLEAQRVLTMLSGNHPVSTVVNYSQNLLKSTERFATVLNQFKNGEIEADHFSLVATIFLEEYHLLCIAITKASWEISGLNSLKKESENGDK